jgi:hypothetical protein
MTPADAGALMRLADELADIRVIPLAAVTILQRLLFKYRPRGGTTACVDLAELAGDGLCKTTLLRLLGALERARLIVKEKWGIVRNGRWRQMPNKYRGYTLKPSKFLKAFKINGVTWFGMVISDLRATVTT